MCGGVLCALLATLSKEAGFTVLAVMALQLVCDEIQHLKKTHRSNYSLFRCSTLGQLRVAFAVQMSALLFAVMSLFGWRLWFQGGKAPTYSSWQNYAAFHPNFLTRCLSLPYLATRHLGLLLYPYILCPDYSNMAIPVLESILDQRVLCVAVTIGVFTYSFYKTFQVSSDCYYSYERRLSVDTD